LDLNSISPHISGPNHVKTMTNLHDAERKNITWHSNMDLIPNIFDVLKKLSIEVEVIFNKEFLPNKEYDRKKIALHCWEKINYNLINSLYRK